MGPTRSLAWALFTVSLVLAVLALVQRHDVAARSSVAALTATVALPDRLPEVDARDQWPPRLEDALCVPKVYLYATAQVDALQPLREAHRACRFTAYSSETMLYAMLRDETSAAHRLYVTDNPDEANVFWVPFFGDCFFQECKANSKGPVKAWSDCEPEDRYIKPLLSHIASRYPYWNRTNGADHVIVHPMDGIAAGYYDRAVVQHYMGDAVFLTTAGDKRIRRNRSSSQFRLHRDIVIPSTTTILHQVRKDPLDYLDPATGQPRGGRLRDIKVLFRGNAENVKPGDLYSHGVRSLFPGFAALPGWNISRWDHPDRYAELLARSRFGLAPEGWTADTTRVWEYLAFGVVPVIIADGILEPFEDDADWRSFALFVRRDEAHLLPQILDDVSPQQYERLRRRVWSEGRLLDLDRHAIDYIMRSLCRSVVLK